MILAADVGGTKTLLGLFETGGRRLRCVREESFPSQDSPSLESIVLRFLEGSRVRVRSAAVGVAGPVVRGKSQVVNLKWPVDARKLARSLRIPDVVLLNDLEATAWGIPALAPKQMVSLTRGRKPIPGNAALIAAGTGLGMAILFWDGKRYRPSASEGGHQGFSPQNVLEDGFAAYLRKRYGRVSVERAVSGPAMFAIYDYLVASGRGRRTALMRERLRTGDKNAAVAAAGVAGEDATARRAVDLFVSLYGSAAGDLALVAKASGGVYVGGGIAPKILPRLRSGDFLRAFRGKGRLGPFVEKIPVKVVLEPRTALLGAAARAALA